MNENVIKLDSIFKVLKSNILMIAFWAIIGLVCATIYAFFFVTPKYSSTIDLLVNQRGTTAQDQYTAQQADLQAINTYKDVLKKSFILEPVLQEVKEKDNYQGGMNNLKNSVEITNQTNSKVLSVTVTTDNAYIASDIANSIGINFKKKMKKLMNANNVTVVNKATPNTDPISPNKKLYALLGFIIGGGIAALIILVREMFDVSVKTSEFLTDELGLVNLGSVYHIDHKDKDYQIVEVVPKNGRADGTSYRRI